MRDVDVPQRGVVAALDQRRPVHHLHVGLEAGRLQILGHHQRHPVVEVVLLAGEDLDRRAVVLGGLATSVRGRLRRRPCRRCSVPAVE